MYFPWVRRVLRAVVAEGSGDQRSPIVEASTSLHRMNWKDIVANNTRARRKVRISRSLGIALTPKAEKYMERRPYGPGQHGRARRKQDSDYAVRLREKQRLRAQYGIREAQMTRVFEEARNTAGLTGENLIELLEMRLDALVLRAGFARTIAQARQLVVHRHIMVDGKRVDRPSFRVSEGQLVHVHERSEKMPPFQVAAAGAHRDVLPNVPAYLDVTLEKLQARLVRRPKRAEVPVTCEEQLVVEYYAR
jgi:small subunit ribosomal protein S4